ncbi:MAG TPA: sugar phosphate nucleotidyltransferase [Acidimicrobiales bacterium]|nr:sugar phosphate nucleotidyltransferase [Acidimicrobiales bacterium]
MKTVILCGGKGTRAYPHTVDVPKPLLYVGGRPVLSHVMEIYANQGFREFVLAAGYKRELIENWAVSADASWTVEVVDTGEDTNTGARVARVADRLGDTFFVTYADGLGDVDLRALLEFHRSHPGAATLTTVPLPSQYGTLHVGADGRIEEFREKPRLPDHPINAGFFVFDRRAFEWWTGDDLERDVLPALGAAGELFAYRHPGFWKSMDTHKDSRELSAMFEHGRGPWTVDAPILAS